MKIKLAELIIDLGDVGEFTRNMCQNYIADDNETVDFAVSVSDAVLEQEQKLYPSAEPDYLENICLYREICKKIVYYNAMLLHSAALAVDEKAYLFSANSGTGKTTHINLWLKKFGDRAVVINGDKPIIREIDGELRVYGTPWCGKEGLNQNTSAVLSGICFLNRGKENKIAQISKPEALSELMAQTIRLDEPSGTMKVLDTLDKIIMATPVYRLFCNMEPDAAEVAYNGMC